MLLEGGVLDLTKPISAAATAAARAPVGAAPTSSVVVPSGGGSQGSGVLFTMRWGVDQGVLA